MFSSLLRHSVFIILLQLAACSPGPETAVQQCLVALCQDRPETLKDCLTDDSYRLFMGMRGVTPALVACSPDDVTITSSRVIDAEGTLTRLSVSGTGDALQTVIAHRSDGDWRIDLFMIGWDDTVGRAEMFAPGGSR